MKPSEVREALERTGLSRYEAIVLVNLARLGAATAREVARASGVNRVQTYRALDSLEGRGLIEVTLDRPKRYAARAIREIFDMITEEMRADLESLESMRKGILEAWPQIAQKEGTAVRLQVIKGRTQIYRTIARLVGEANREVLAFTTTKGLQRSYRAGINEVLLSSMRRGVTARLLADISEKNVGLMKRVAARVALRHLDSQRARFILIDGSSVLAFLVQDEGTIRGDAESALWTNSPDFVRACSDFFDGAWRVAVPASRRLAALQLSSARGGR